MITRRQFLKLAGVAAVMPWGCVQWGTRPPGILLNDVHSGLNQTSVHEMVVARSAQDIQRAIERAMRERRDVSVAIMDTQRSRRSTAISQTDRQEVQVLVSTLGKFMDQFHRYVRLLIQGRKGSLVHDGQHVAGFTNFGHQHLLRCQAW